MWVRLDTQYFWGKRRRLSIRFGATSHPQALFQLTTTGKHALTAQDRALLAEALGHSNVDVPKGPGDSDGRFVRYNFPNNLTLADVRAVVLETPDAIEPLPTPASRQ